MTPQERQRARERAADGIAPRESCVIAPEGWPAPLAHPHGLTATERRARLRAAEKARKVSA